MNTTEYTIKGRVPLIMHNGQLSDPLSEAAKALSKLAAIRKKTEKTHLEIAECEWRGGLYLDDKGAPCIPGEVIEACLVEGAKKHKLGKVAKGAIVVDGNAPLEYDGPRTADGLWKNGGFLNRASVKIKQNRVMRSRPIFHDWGLTFVVQWDEEMIKDEDQLNDIVEAAGNVGLCDWRPKFGRFKVEV